MLCLCVIASSYPRKPSGWHRHQDDKARIRKATIKGVARTYQRRLTKLYAPLVLVGGEALEDELRELEELATALWPISLDMAERRVSGGK